ncbi:MAG: proteasome activator [Microthrixaceae bacterium]
MSDLPSTDASSNGAAAELNLQAPPELVTPDDVSVGGPEQEPGDGDSDIESPAKIIRIGAMVKQLLEEARNTSIDDATRDQLARIHANSVAELKSALSPELGAELDSLSFDFSGDSPPSEAELRMAQAQLVGWLEGLFHGIQATLVAQQMAARQQLEGMRQQLPEMQRPAGPGPGYI